MEYHAQGMYFWENFVFLVKNVSLSLLSVWIVLLVCVICMASNVCVVYICKVNWLPMAINYTGRYILGEERM